VVHIPDPFDTTNLLWLPASLSAGLGKFTVVVDGLIGIGGCDANNSAAPTIRLVIEIDIFFSFTPAP
jgi:hypothetical protein